MNTLETLRTYANQHWAVDKTRKTSCSLKKNGVTVSQDRLWVWAMGMSRPLLVTNSDLSGSDKEDFSKIIKAVL